MRISIPSPSRSRSATISFRFLFLSSRWQRIGWLCDVGADQRNDIGRFQVFVAARRPIAAKRQLVSRCRARHTQRRVAVMVRCLKAKLHQLARPFLSPSFLQTVARPPPFLYGHSSIGESSIVRINNHLMGGSRAVRGRPRLQTAPLPSREVASYLHDWVDERRNSVPKRPKSPQDLVGEEGQLPLTVALRRRC